MGADTPLPSKKELCASYGVGAHTPMNKYGGVYTHDVLPGILTEKPMKEPWVRVHP